MYKEPKYYVVSADILPESFRKVAIAKHMLETKEAANLSDAARKVDISRSVIYKYKDSIFPYSNKIAGRVINLYVAMKDVPGMLQKTMNIFYKYEANILTINQNIPVDGKADVSFSISMDIVDGKDIKMIEELRKIEGVKDVKRLSSI